MSSDVRQAEHANIRRRLYYVIVVVMLMICTHGWELFEELTWAGDGAGVTRFGDRGTNVHDGYQRVPDHAWGATWWLPLYLFSVGMMAWIGIRLFVQGSLFALIRNNAALIALVFLPVFSALWAGPGNLVFRLSLPIVATSAFGFVLALSLRPREVVLCLAVALAIVELASVAGVAAWPEHTVSSGFQVLVPFADGAWRGFFKEKNSLGGAAALACLVALEAKSTGGGRDRLYARWAGLMFLCLSAALLLLSASRTSLFAAVSALSGYGVLSIVLRYPRSRRYVIGAVVIACVVCAGVLLIYRAEIGAALESPDTLTGRVHIWREIWPSITSRLWLGHGFDAFWASIAPVELIVFSGGYTHNGYLDLWLNVGLVGVALYLLTLLLTFASYGRSFLGAEGACSIFPLSFLIFFTVYNLAENEILSRSLIWALFVYFAVRARTASGSPG